jgi:hypothetical protein
MADAHRDAALRRRPIEAENDERAYLDALAELGRREEPFLLLTIFGGGGKLSQAGEREQALWFKATRAQFGALCGACAIVQARGATEQMAETFRRLWPFPISLEPTRPRPAPSCCSHKRRAKHERAIPKPATYRLQGSAEQHGALPALRRAGRALSRAGDPVLSLRRGAAADHARAGVSRTAIGYMSILLLPLVIKFFWAPWIDRIRPFARAHRPAGSSSPRAGTILCILALIAWSGRPRSIARSSRSALSPRC